MKKLLFSAYSLDIGGIEKALVTLANTLQEKEYDVTIVLEQIKGVFLDDLNKHNIKFALSNVLRSKGKKNSILIDWTQKNYNKCKVINLNYNYNNSNYQTKNKNDMAEEVLIINY